MDELKKLIEKMPYLFLLEKPFLNDEFDTAVFKALSYNNQMN